MFKECQQSETYLVQNQDFFLPTYKKCTKKGLEQRLEKQIKAASMDIKSTKITCESLESRVHKAEHLCYENQQHKNIGKALYAKTVIKLFV